MGHVRHLVLVFLIGCAGSASVAPDAAPCPDAAPAPVCPTACVTAPQDVLDRCTSAFPEGFRGYACPLDTWPAHTSCLDPWGSGDAGSDTAGEWRFLCCAHTPAPPPP